MMFWFKPKKIHVDCFTKHEKIAKANPIKKAHHFVPDWWKKLDNVVYSKNPNGMAIPNATMKSCAGFIDLYRSGLIMPMWCDFLIEVHGDSYRYQIAIADAGFKTDQPVVIHQSFQNGNHYENKINIKIHSPWQLREKTGVKFLYTPCTWETVKKIPKVGILNGILDFKYQHGTNVQTFFPSEVDQYRVEIDAGMPLVQIIPLSEKRVVPHIHVIDEIEFERFKSASATHKFSGGYLDFVKKMKRNS